MSDDFRHGVALLSAAVLLFVLYDGKSRLWRAAVSGASCGIAWAVAGEVAVWLGVEAVGAVMVCLAIGFFAAADLVLSILQDRAAVLDLLRLRRGGNGGQE